MPESASGAPVRNSLPATRGVSSPKNLRAALRPYARLGRRTHRRNGRCSGSGSRRTRRGRRECAVSGPVRTADIPDIILRMEPFRRHDRTAQATPSHTSTGTARRRNGLRSPKAYGIPASASASASRPALAYGAALSRSVCSGSCLPLNAHISAMRDRRLCSGKKFIGFPDKARKCDSGLVRPGETSHVFG